MKSIKAIDFFSGAGGLTNGLKMAGIDVFAGIDFEQSCKETYEQNNNAMFINKSIVDISIKEIINILNVSEESLIKALKLVQSLGLIPIGAKSWIAKTKNFKFGDIVLIHGNGNESIGVTYFLNFISKMGFNIPWQTLEQWKTTE